MKYLAVKDFAKFQHYRDRNPLWIKLYGALLTDLRFLEMPEAAQAQLVKLWILASQMGNPLPNNPKLLAGKIGTTGRFWLAAIIAAGFLIPCEDVASASASENGENPLAESAANASAYVRAPARSRKRGELELEREPSSSVPSPVAEEVASPPWQPILEQPLAGRLATDADRIALTALLKLVERKAAWVAELSVMLDGGMSGHPSATPGQLGEALRDYVANGRRDDTPNLRHFRGYVERVVRGQPATNGTGNGTGARRGGVAQRTYENGRRALEDL